jgi:hypothetical protein
VTSSVSAIGGIGGGGSSGKRTSLGSRKSPQRYENESQGNERFSMMWRNSYNFELFN